MPNEDLVAVMVPRAHLSKVYGLIATLDSDTPEPAELTTPTSEESTSDEWTASILRRMVQESPPAMKKILRAMAEHPNEWVTMDQLIDSLEEERADSMTVAGTMGAFGRRLKNRYEIEGFPFEKHYSHEESCKVYRMSQHVASTILSVLDET